MRLPDLAPGVSVKPLLRRTVELWLNDKVTPEGRVFYTMEPINQYDSGIPMDANPSVLIGAWCYVQASGDSEWLRRQIDRLELVSAFTDGELHDVWSDVPTSIAITSGVIAPEDGAAMLDRHWAELNKTGFKYFEVGLPLNLRPIPSALMLKGYGGRKEDGSDTFRKYLNGGACVSNTSFWLLANYLAGRRDRADMVLDAMLERQRKGVFPNGGPFQNGIIDRVGAGAEFFDWEGNTTGYEGHLVYSWAWMQALFAASPKMEAEKSFPR